MGKTVAEIKRVISELGRARPAAAEPRAATSAVARRAPRSSRLARGESPQGGARVPGPFEVYLLDGDRFIRVDSRNRSVLLDMQTGETTWMASDATRDSHR
jgi:hypothetical protein